MASMIVAVLAQVHADLVAGLVLEAFLKLNVQYAAAAEALQELVERATPSPRLLTVTLAAVRWPVVDLMAAAERHLHPLIYSFAVERFDDQKVVDVKQDCLDGQRPDFVRAVHLARHFAEKSLATVGSPIPHPYIRWMEESDELVSVTRDTKPRFIVEAFEQLPVRCKSAAPLRAMLIGLACVEQQFVALRAPNGDPEACIHGADNLVRALFWTVDFPLSFLLMDHTGLPVFGLWLRFRHLATHRLELPFASTHDLATALGVQANIGAGPVDPSWSDGLRAALPAFDALVNQSGLAQPVALLTMCWGEAHAARLKPWLRAVERAGRALETIVMCFDLAALTACRAVHARPLLCADARAWPASFLSKLVAVAQCLARGVSVLWLDTDAVVLRDPIPFLQPAFDGQDGDARHLRQTDMLYSVEGDSWNCINSGVFFTRATEVMRRYIGYWISLHLERPIGSEQATLYLLLGLYPTMNYGAFAMREGLMAAASPRVRTLGHFKTPVWGPLDSRVHFVMTYEATYGGVERGRTSDLAVFHMLDSWPRELVGNPIYADVHRPDRDIVTQVVEGIGSASEEERAAAWALVCRSERGWQPLPGAPGGRRDCRGSYLHGR